MKTLTIMSIALVLAFAMVGTVSAATADRDLPASVWQGEEFRVAITASGCGLGSQVVETLPPGFTYVSSSLNASEVNDTGTGVVKFTFLGDGKSFTYNVTAPATGGTYPFSGIVKDVDKIESPVTGDYNVQVLAPSASRDLPTVVQKGENFTVAIAVSEYGASGQVEETLPAGFAYVSSSLDPSNVTAVGSTVTFALSGETSFTYTVTAPNTVGDHTFDGTLTDEDAKTYPVGGDTNVTVTVAVRDLPASATAGSTMTVAITASDYGAFAQVHETLPAGFTYLSSSLDDSQVNATLGGNVVRFTLIGETSFTYTATASGTTGTYNFSGTITDAGKNVADIGGDTSITVASAVSTGGGGGGGTYPSGWGETTTATPAVTATAASTATPTVTPPEEAVTKPTKPAVEEMPAVIAEETPTKKPGIPGFTAVFAIAGLLAIAYAMMRRRE